jgi:predicted transposase YdaD
MLFNREDGLKKGRQEGLREGLREGRKKTILQVAQALNMPVEELTKLIDCNTEQINSTKTNKQSPK